MQPNFTQKAGALLAAKLQQQSGARVDMFLADSVPVSASSSKVLIGYTARFGQPDAKQVVAFVAHKFAGKLDPKLETLQAVASKTGKTAMSLVLASKRAIMPISEKPNMLAVSSTMFMDQTIGANWEVKTRADGTEYFECIRGENVQELINMSIASQGPLSGVIRFGEQVTASVEVGIGDFVEFYTDQGIRRGDVTKVGQDGKVSILAEDRQWVVEAPAVRSILRLNPKAEEEKNKSMESFYAAIWGPEFAKKLVRNA
jgi:hypothetical protein